MAQAYAGSIPAPGALSESGLIGKPPASEAGHHAGSTPASLTHLRAIGPAWSGRFLDMEKSAGSNPAWPTEILSPILNTEKEIIC